MKLFTSHTSPFVRKISILLLETGLDAKVERVPTHTTPLKPSPPLVAMNPLGKLPALVLADGSVLFDSAVIMQYLDSLHQTAKFYPEKGVERFHVMRDEALADGILDALILCRYEKVMRPAEKQWDGWIDVQMTKALGGLTLLESQIATRKAYNSNGNDAGLTAIAGVLGFLDFRMPELNWRTTHPRLAAWEKTFATRPSVKATVPHE